MENSLLSGIHSPADVKKIPEEQLPTLCEEIRQTIISVVSHNGGHLSSNLGVVELTVALNRVFDPPHDKIIWDVGHQTYTHKMLTGRFAQMDTIRCENGLSGFQNKDESPYDVVTTGHSSTSVSTAVGLAAANHLRGENGYVVAVIGDGALTGGLAMEALNNISKQDKNLIIILNDNRMSISKNVGAVARSLGKMRLRPRYLDMKTHVEAGLEKIPGIGRPLADCVRKVKEKIRSGLLGSTIFSEMGLAYYGPFDGHDLPLLTDVLTNAKSIHKPTLIHVVTSKGQGYYPAIENPDAYHGVSPFDIERGNVPSEKENFSHVFGEELCQLAEKDAHICAITAAMQLGTGLTEFKKKFPQRFFDVGIAEGHAVTFAGGLAVAGLAPVFAVYSTFLQRGYDELLHDVAMQHVHVVLAVDRAGLVPGDGESHQGLFDAAFLQTVPGMTVYSPAYYEELRLFLRKAVASDGAVAVRYPRGEEPVLPDDFAVSDADFVRYGAIDSPVMLVTYGRTFAACAGAAKTLCAQGIPTSVIKLNRIAPLPMGAVYAVQRAKLVLFAEEGVTVGGIGEHFFSLLSQRNFAGTMHLQAIPNTFVRHAKVESMLTHFGLDEESLVQTVLQKNGGR